MSRHIVRMKHPASWHGESWREALMLGNGLTGILVHGAIAEETIQINRFDLWHGGNEGRDIPDISDTFAKMRSDIQNVTILLRTRTRWLAHSITRDIPQVLRHLIRWDI